MLMAIYPTACLGINIQAQEVYLWEWIKQDRCSGKVPKSSLGEGGEIY